MKRQVWESGFNLWLSANDTYDWAHRPGRRWPCSQLSGKRLFVQYDRNGLCDLAVNGKIRDIDAQELTACVSDAMRGKLHAGHPCECYMDYGTED